MTLPEEGYLLRILIGEDDKHEGVLLVDGADHAVGAAASGPVSGEPSSQRSAHPSRLVEKWAGHEFDDRGRYRLG